jgi:hypothetical protein
MTDTLRNLMPVLFVAAFVVFGYYTLSAHHMEPVRALLAGRAR